MARRRERRGTAGLVPDPAVPWTLPCRVEDQADDPKFRAPEEASGGPVEAEWERIAAHVEVLHLVGDTQGESLSGCQLSAIGARGSFGSVTLR